MRAGGLAVSESGRGAGLALGSSRVSEEDGKGFGEGGDAAHSENQNA